MLLILTLAGAIRPATAAPVNLPPAASSEVRQAVEHAITAGDAAGLPFAVVDKKNARLYVFDATGTLRGVTPVLLGSAVGDTYFPGLNQRNLSQLAAHERTSPAGRFAAQPGRNLTGEAVVWIDYDSAFAIHRLRPAAAQERRGERLVSATPDDNRISLGCVITSVAFYEQVVAPVLGASRSVVYVLPDGPFSSDVFDAL
ncbi:MAG: L,D-transpeptidase [Burkholderiaceae bacterium]|nr:L,D-transpeptidase [Burkholderiaceae bacterium]